MHHQPQRGLFYGWIVVTAALIIVAIGVGLMFSLSVFMELLEQAFGWSREQIARAMGISYGAIFLLSCFGMGLGGWLGGRIFDAVGMYTVMYVLSFVFSVSGAVLAICLRPPRHRWAPIMNPQTVSAS